MEDLNTISNFNSSFRPYELVFQALLMIPITHYLIGFTIFIVIFLYNFLESHLISDLLTGFRGPRIKLVYHPDSEIYQGVVSKCRILHGRFLATPWLASPHLQTAFLNFFGRPPVFSYRRQIFRAPDGGTLALDWLLSSDGGAAFVENKILRHDTTPIVVVIPGLTSDSDSAYLKHLAYNTAKCGRNVVVCNHRGLGGVSITSDCFYNAAWTEDIRVIIRHLHCEYPDAPLFIVGTSIGANVLVKYLGEEGEDVPIAGAVAICCPWDLLIGSRFICRRFVQKFYDRALAIGLQGYAQLHEPRYTRLANWEGIAKSRSIRDFDNHATRIVGKYKTVDTYYRVSSSSSYVVNAAVPLLCISALDDPVCTSEAIPWDECRVNKNVVLATPQHGGHLAFFEGITASSIWWVRAANEFLGVLHLSPYMHKQRKIPALVPTLEPSIDQGPFVNVSEDGMIAAASNEPSKADMAEDSSELDKQISDVSEQDEQSKDCVSKNVPLVSQSAEQVSSTSGDTPKSVTFHIKRRLDQLSRHSKKSMWLLAYVAIITSWPVIGSGLFFFFKRKIKKSPHSTLQKRQ
ncbi:hypothetical protein RND81_03G232000 [Saponaria officinalis]|uniref:Serine aminopeptidase S33 domain-containing protein n=1 Tax=Saponaria officinalis TaxID=3572 RepID=A0AAW1MAS4_SAPOF